MGSSACLLVMEYIPGRALLSEEEPFQAQHILRTAEDLGRWCFAASKRDECAMTTRVRGCSCQIGLLQARLSVLCGS